MTTATPLPALSADARADLMRRVRDRAGVSADRVDTGPAPRPAGTAVPATPVQRQMFYLHRLAPGVPNYTTAFAVEIDGPLDADRLGSALERAVARHESLRTRLVHDGGEIVPEIADVATPPLTAHDTSGAAEPEAAAWSRAEALATTPFPPDERPLWRAELVTIAPDHHLFVLAASHAVFDGVSMGLLTEEVAAYHRDDGSAPTSDPLQHGDVALWHAERLAGPRRAELSRYWREQLAGLPSPSFPLDAPRSAAPSLRAGAVYRPLDPELLADVDRVAARHGATRFTLLLAAYLATLGRMSGSTDVAVGVPLDGRYRTALADVVGSLTNTVVVRGRPEPDLTFAAFLERLRPDVAAAMGHQDMPLGTLVEELAPRREGAAPPLVQTLFNFAGIPADRAAFRFGPDTTGRLHGLSNRSVRFDFELSVDDTPAGTVLRFDHAVDVVGPESARDIVDGFLGLVGLAVADPGRTVDELATRAGCAPRTAAASTAAPAAQAAGEPDRTGGSEDLLARLWSEALDRDDVPRDTDFFTLGGSSLLAVTLGERIAAETGVALPLIELLTAGSVAELAHTLDAASTSASTP